MDTVRTGQDLRARIRAWRTAGQRIALVPTMGALHQGHLALVAIARAHAHRVVASVFVNPAQFDDEADLDRYPRQEGTDAALLAGAGCDLLFAPPPEAIYPAGYATVVRVTGLDSPLEGAARPGHFDGVATVVTKLLMLAFPDVAVFGEKDWQQLALIRRLVLDLELPVEIVGGRTIREPDGLAMSSRNARLEPSQRAVAGALPRTLRAAAQALAEGARPGETLATARAALGSAGFRIDYLALADETTLEMLETARPGARLFVAARLGDVRLIDNMAVPWRRP